MGLTTKRKIQYQHLSHSIQEIDVLLSMFSKILGQAKKEGKVIEITIGDSLNKNQINSLPALKMYMENMKTLLLPVFARTGAVLFTVWIVG